MIHNPFTRTSCACRDCQACCERQPGFLIPDDYERIREYLKVPDAELQARLWASQGGVVMDSTTGRQFRIRTITPRRDRFRKRCTFQDDKGQCTIHSVAPFGCAYVDTHMSAAMGNKRSTWALKVIASDGDYTALRDQLPFADSYKPTRY